MTPTLACMLLPFLLAASGPAEPAAKVLRLQGGDVDPLRAARETAASPARVQVVQARGSARELLSELRRRGWRVLGYLPDDAYLVEVSGGLGPLPSQLLRWQGAFWPEWKRAADLTRLSTGEDCTLRLLAHPGLSLGARRPELKRLGRVLWLSDDLTGTGHAGLRVRAGRLAQALDALAALDEVAWIAPARRVGLNNDESTWVIQGGEFASASTPLFDQGLTGRGQVIAVADSGLDTDACQFRYGAASEQQTLFNTTQPPAASVTDPDNKVIAYYLLDGATAYDDRSKLGHGTHVSGCAAGDNYAHLAQGADPGRDPEDGMAPAAQIVFQDTGRNDGQQAGLPASLVDMFAQAHASGAHIHNDSYGMTDVDNSYGSDSREVDEAAWRYPDMLIVFSSGNLGPASASLDGIGSTSKNPLVVGASLAGLSNQGRGVCHFSSQGPTADGRIRPDLVAPGAIRSALETDWIDGPGTDIFGQPVADSTTDPPNDNCQVDASYRIGTSFSAPLVAGGAALARQYFVDGFYPSGQARPADGFVPSAALLKATLISAAESIDGPLYDVSQGSVIRDLAPAPSSVQGWGLMRLDRSLAFGGDPETLAVLNDSYGDGVDRGAASRSPLEEGQEQLFGLEGVRVGAPLRIVLNWTDPAGTAGSGRALVNDLNLEVRDPDGVLYRGNVSFASNRSQPAGAAAADDRNPVEVVILQPARGGDYTVRVVGAAVPGNGQDDPYPSWRQGYALVAVGEFDAWCVDPPCSGPSDGGDGGGEDGEDGGPVDAGDPGAADEGGGDGGGPVTVRGGCACGPDSTGTGSWSLILLLICIRRRWGVHA